MIAEAIEEYFMRLKHALLAVFILMVAGGVLAAEAMQATTCTVARGETIEGNLLAVCRELRIDGRVEGSIFGVALTANIAGEVTGDVYLLSRGLEVTGRLGDDLHFAGGSLELKSGSEWVNGSLVAIAVDISLEEETRVPEDVNAVAYQLNSRSEIGRDMLYAGESLTLSGSVERDVFAHVGDTTEENAPQLVVGMLSLALALDTAPSGLRIADNATIGRHLDYIAPSAAQILGRIQGDVSYTPVTNAPTIGEIVAEESRSDALRQYFGQVVQDILVLTVMGSLLLLLTPSLVQRPTRSVKDRPALNALFGVGTFALSFPFLALTLTFSVLGVALLSLLGVDSLTIAAAVTLGLANFGGGGVFYFICGYIARLVVAAALGTFILERVSAKELTIRDWMLGVAVGAAIVALLSALPAVGWVFNLLVIGLGLGAIVRLIWKVTRPQVISTPGPLRVVLTPPTVMTLPPQLPPPLVDDTPPARGMENLPKGFRWWDDE